MTYALILTPFVAAAAGDVLKRRLARVRVPVQCRVVVLVLCWLVLLVGLVGLVVLVLVFVVVLVLVVVPVLVLVMEVLFRVPFHQHVKRNVTTRA
jgi:hypothetical protein